MLPPDVHEVCATHLAALHVSPAQHPRLPHVAPDGEQLPGSVEASDPDDDPPLVEPLFPLLTPLLLPPPLLLPAPLLPPLDALVVPESGSVIPDDDSDEQAATTITVESMAGRKTSVGLDFRTISRVRPSPPAGPTGLRAGEPSHSARVSAYASARCLRNSCPSGRHIC
jgi:hypothetical protein